MDVVSASCSHGKRNKSHICSPHTAEHVGTVFYHLMKWRRGVAVACCAFVCPRFSECHIHSFNSSPDGWERDSLVVMWLVDGITWLMV